MSEETTPKKKLTRVELRKKLDGLPFSQWHTVGTEDEIRRAMAPEPKEGDSLDTLWNKLQKSEDPDAKLVMNAIGVVVDKVPKFLRDGHKAEIQLDKRRFGLIKETELHGPGDGLTPSGNRKRVPVDTFDRSHKQDTLDLVEVMTKAPEQK